MLYPPPPVLTGDPQPSPSPAPGATADTEYSRGVMWLAVAALAGGVCGHRVAPKHPIIGALGGAWLGAMAAAVIGLSRWGSDTAGGGRQ